MHGCQPPKPNRSGNGSRAGIRFTQCATMFLNDELMIGCLWGGRADCRPADYVRFDMQNACIPLRKIAS
jgi:hypothetical protein